MVRFGPPGAGFSSADMAAAVMIALKQTSALVAVDCMRRTPLASKASCSFLFE